MRMLVIASIACALVGNITPVYAKSSKSGGSHVSRGGHYAGGKGSSHKGGDYKNKRTNDHYQKRNK
jgi:hypothetical protein